MTIGRNRVRQVQDVITVQWANGKNEGRLTPGTGRFVSHVGFYVEAGRDGGFDAWVEAAGVSQMEIRHPRAGAAAEIVRHWNLGEQVRLYPVTSGPIAPTVAASLAPRNVQATVEAGLGIRWGRGEGERSKLAVRGYLQVGKEVYGHLVQISVRSRMTDELLTALVDHVRVCEIADNLIDRTKHPEVIQCHELALPLGAGKEEQWGKGETTTVFPLTSLHPPSVDLPYLRSLWRPEAVAEMAVQDWQDIQAWAQEFSFAQPGQPADDAPQHEEPHPAYANGRAAYATDVL
jgi:hypothetical protein